MCMSIYPPKGSIIARLVSDMKFVELVLSTTDEFDQVNSSKRYMQRFPQCARIRTTMRSLTCVHVRAVPSTFDKYLRASRIAVPAVAFVSPPPLPFVANTTASADIGDVRVADCETGRL